MRLRVLVATAVLALTMTACGDSGSKSGLPELSATPSAKPTTGTPLDQVPQSPPKRPKDVQSTKGAVEFSSYVVEMISYTLATNKADELFAIADRQLCQACKRVSDGVEEREGRLQILDEAVLTKDAKPALIEGGFYNISQSTDWPGGSEVYPKTGKVSATIRDPGPTDMTVNLQWRRGKWVLLDYKFPDEKG